MKADPRFADRGLRPSRAERDGEYTDKAGRTYDQMGDPDGVPHWNEQVFHNSIRKHLLKSVDFIVIDMNGYAAAHIASVRRYLDTLTPQELAKILRIRF
ncbi:hypothetical protein JOF53_002031 [Crossiella equi]|uniref:Uncharacterized protein n=1 Tax=Crossiella equi TaxID=130796 RepID=A0ABS5A992_9PSEU|nr:hypothetical protein [Crossiella equi]MBP2473159.1 hypothetical protein [Crossiella equi]